MIHQKNHEVSLFTPRRDKKALIYKELDIDDDISVTNLLKPNYYVQEALHKNTFNNFSPWNSKNTSLDIPSIGNFSSNKKMRQIKNSITNGKSPQINFSNPRTTQSVNHSTQKTQTFKVQKINLKLNKPHLIPSNRGSFNLAPKRNSQDNIDQVLQKHFSIPKTTAYYVVQPRQILKHQRFQLIQLSQSHKPKEKNINNISLQHYYNALKTESPGQSIQTTVSPKHYQSKRYAYSLETNNTKTENPSKTKQFLLSDNSSLKINHITRNSRRKSPNMKTLTVATKPEETITSNFKKTIAFAILDQDIDLIKSQGQNIIQDLSLETLKKRVKRRFLKKNMNRIIHFNARAGIVTTNQFSTLNEVDLITA